jgi:RNA-binding protein YhbY
MNWTNLALVAAPFAACMSAPGGQKPVVIGLYVVGDDGATQGLAETLRQQLTSSGRYRLGLAEDRGATRLTITNHVRSIVARGVDYIGYRVAFARPDGSELGRSTGRCPIQRMEVCASRIVLDLNRTLRSRRHR